MAFAFLPLSSFAFGQAALVAFAAGATVFLAGQAALFCFGQDFGGGVVVIGGLCDGGAGSFFEKFDDLDFALVGVIGGWNLEAVSGFHWATWFQGAA